MKLSIIIPALNEEDYIEKTLKSIKDSDYQDYEIIVVANGCTDNTVEKSKLADKILVLKEKGVSLARNKGVEIAKGKVFVFLDADILVKKNTLSEIASLPIPVIGTCYASPNVNNWKANFFQWIKNSFAWIGWSNGIIIASKEVFEFMHGFDESLDKGEDGLFIRVAKKKYPYKTIGHVINDMRRFEKTGYFSNPFYWVKERFFPSGKEYPPIR